jgi:hypothetical protein
MTGLLWFSTLTDLRDHSAFSSATTQSVLGLHAKIPIFFVNRPPGEMAISDGWVSLGKLPSGKLVFDIPGNCHSFVQKRWRWFTVERKEPNAKMYTEDQGYFRVSADPKDAEMFSLLTYFLLSHMASSYSTGDIPAELFKNALDGWVTYLGAQALDVADLHTGAFGELYVLWTLIGEFGPSVVHGWHGPRKSSQDFRVDTGGGRIVGIEVKTTGVGAETLPINGIDQLAAPGALLAVRQGPSEFPRFIGSLKDLITNIRNSPGVSANELAVFDELLGMLDLQEGSEYFTESRTVACLEIWDMADLPHFELHGPGSQRIGSVRAKLQPGPGVQMGNDSKLAPFLANLKPGGTVESCDDSRLAAGPLF